MGLYPVEQDSDIVIVADQHHRFIAEQARKSYTCLAYHVDCIHAQQGFVLRRTERPSREGVFGEDISADGTFLSAETGNIKQQSEPGQLSLKCKPSWGLGKFHLSLKISCRVPARSFRAAKRRLDMGAKPGGPFLSRPQPLNV